MIPKGWPPVLGLAEVADFYGLTHPAALARTRRKDHPNPCAWLNSGRVYWLHEIRAYAAAYKLADPSIRRAPGLTRGPKGTARGHHRNTAARK